MLQNNHTKCACMYYDTKLCIINTWHHNVPTSITHVFHQIFAWVLHVHKSL